MLVLTVPIIATHAVTPRSRLVTLDLQGYALDFQPGQAVLVGAAGQPERRPYSLACSPERAAETGRLELLIAAEPDGTLGANFGPAAPGTLVDVEGPVGTFTLPSAIHAGWALFVAGGTGIAPLRSMIDHVLRQQPSRRVSVLYSARRRDEFAFIDELRAHAREGRLELHQTVTRDDSSTWAGGRGRIGRAQFEAVLHQPDATLCFVCGPRDMVAESVATLQTLGVQDDAIRTEAWKVPGL